MKFYLDVMNFNTNFMNLNANVVNLYPNFTNLIQHVMNFYTKCYESKGIQRVHTVHTQIQINSAYSSLLPKTKEKHSLQPPLDCET